MATSIPPHNAAELCDAALHLIKHRKATSEQLLEFVQGPDFPTGGIIVDTRGDDRRDLSHRARLVPGAGALAQGGHGPRHLGGRRHRDPLRRAEVAPDREDRRAPAGAEAAAPRRRPRRIGRGRARRAGAALAHRRSDHPDGIAVPADRAGKPRLPEPQRALGRQGAARARPRRMPARMDRPSPRRAASAARATGSASSSGAWRSCAASSSSISTSTGSSKSSARRTSRSRS